MAVVRMLTGMAGPGGNWTTGDLYECDEAEGGRLIAAGLAEPVRPSSPEAAMAPPAPERAVTPRAKARSGRP